MAHILEASMTHHAALLPQLNRNRLLAALTAQAQHRILPDLEQISAPLGKVLFESGGQQNYVYFPTSMLVSLLQTMENGQCAEWAVTGYEGVVSIAPFLGGGNMPGRALVQGVGHALRMKANAARAEFERGGSFRRVLLRYTLSLIVQTAQTAACNRLHSIEQQLCRWLLVCHDRTRTDKLIMTHEMISNMLGVRREGVSLAAGRLQRAGVISYMRGHITLTDRTQLEKHVCDCYKVIKTESDRPAGIE